MANIASDTTNISDLPNNTQINQQIPVQQQSNITMSVSPQQQPPQQNQQYQQQMNQMVNGLQQASMQGLTDLQTQVLQAHSIWNIRISTSNLNNWLTEKISCHPPPSVGGKRIRMRYITQVNTRPPSFVIFVSIPERVPESYKRYLVNSLRKDFGLPGVPIRLILRAGKNPYDDKRQKSRQIS